MKKITIVLLVIAILLLLFSILYKHEDVNRDGKVDIKDLLIVQKYILNQNKE